MCRVRSVKFELPRPRSACALSAVGSRSRLGLLAVWIRIALWCSWTLSLLSPSSSGAKTSSFSKVGFFFWNSSDSSARGGRVFLSVTKASLWELAESLTNRKEEQQGCGEGVQPGCVQIGVAPHLASVASRYVFEVLKAPCACMEVRGGAKQVAIRKGCVQGLRGFMPLVH